MKESTASAFANVSIVARYRDPTTPDIIEEQCYDISRGGMFVRSFKPLPSGTLIKFACRVDDNPNDIQGIGRVVWQRKEDDPQAPSGMGVKFLVLRPGSPEIIDRIIRRAGPMPNLFDSAQEAGRQREKARAQQRTSYRARTLVGNQANNLASEIKRNRFAKREQLILTAKNAQRLVVDAKKKGAKKTQTQGLSQVRSAPVIAIKQDDKPREELTAVDATGQQQEVQSQTEHVQTVAHDEGRRDRDDAIGTEAKAADDNTARALQLAAQRARELVEKEATLRNIELAAENAIGAGKRNRVLSAKGLVFASIIAVILLRIGYAVYGETESGRRVLQQRSVGASTQHAAAQVETGRRPSQEMAAQARALEQPAVETTEEIKRPTLAEVESSEQDSLEKGVQPRPIKSDTVIKPQEPRTARASEREERFEKAKECRDQGDHLCVIRLLSNRVGSEKERRLLAEAYRSVEEKKRAVEEEELQVHSEAESWEMPPENPVSRKSTSGIPNNPYPE